MVIVSEILLYLCFSILIGSLILKVIPKSIVPTIKIPKSIVLATVLGIPLFSFFPIIDVILHLYEDIGFWVTVKSAIFSFQIGQAWIFTVILSYTLFFIVLLGNFQSVKELPYVGLFITFLLVLALGWSSHASSMYSWLGFLWHTVHFLSVCVWVGILIVVSWWSSDHSRWGRFLKWYHPLAIICLFLVIFSGVSLMNLIGLVENYSSYWIMPYGQSLLIKHILFVPILAYAVINGVLIKRKLKEFPRFNPIPWTRVESGLLFLIFGVTAILGQQPLPHDIETFLLREGPSSLFLFFYQGTYEHLQIINLGLNWTNGLLILLAVGFFSLIIISFIQKTSAMFSLIMTLLFTVSFYLSVMFSIQ